MVLKILYKYGESINKNSNQDYFFNFLMQKLSKNTILPLFFRFYFALFDKNVYYSLFYTMQN